MDEENVYSVKDLTVQCLQLFELKSCSLNPLIPDPSLFVNCFLE